MSNPLLARLAVVYGQPDSPNPAAYLAEVAKMLAKYGEADLDTAGDTILRTHRGRTFPTPSEIVTACEEVRALRTQVPRSYTFEDSYPEWSAPRIAKADRMICCAMGKRAASEGWVLRLHQFCREEQRLPTEREIPELKASAKCFDEAYSLCCRGEAGVCSAALKRLGDAMLDKRERLARMVDEATANLSARSRAMTGESD
jgi:hypothetical protein